MATIRGASATLVDEMAAPSAKMALLNGWFFGPDGFTAQRDLTSPESSSIAAVLDRQTGTCVGLSIVYLAMAQELGLDAHAKATPDHVYLEVELEDGPRTVELLENGRPVSEEVYRTRYKIEQSSIDAGVFLVPLSDDELIAHLLSNQAVVLSREGRTEEALARYDRALKMNPKLVAAWYNRGIDLMNAGRLEEALESFDRAIELHPNRLLTNWPFFFGPD